jgi:hypothetical protein
MLVYHMAECVYLIPGTLLTDCQLPKWLHEQNVEYSETR